MNGAQKFIVWDWNGTLLDDTYIVFRCVNIALQALNCAPTTLEIFREIHTVSLRDFYRALDVPEERLEHVIEAERDLFHDNYEPLAAHALLRKEAKSVLQCLREKGVANIILSNHITSEILRQLRSHDIADYFSGVLAYADRHTQFRDMTKGERLRRYIEAEGLNPANAMIIGDTEEETKIARALGMGSVAITGGVLSEKMLRTAMPDHVIHELDEFLPILIEQGFFA